MPGSWNPSILDASISYSKGFKLPIWKEMRYTPRGTGKEAGGSYYEHRTDFYTKYSKADTRYE